MEKIIQLKQSEYDELFEKANLTSKLIDKRAAILYEKNGTHTFVLTVRIGDYEDKIKVKANGYHKDWESKYPITTEDAKRVVKFMEHRAEELFEGSFGDVVFNITKLREATKSLEDKKKVFTLFTYLGWFVSLIMFGVTLYLI